MSRSTWKKGELYLSYGKPSITSYDRGGNELTVESMSEVMYFYYDITLLHDNKVLLEMRTHDFPKVQNLPSYIEHLMDFDMDKAYLLEDIEDNGYQRKVRYHQILLEDSFGLDIEYFYKIERYDYFVKQHHEDAWKEWTEYVLTVGEMEVSKEHGGSNREDFGKTVTIKNITPSELCELKDTAIRFCQEAIRSHNNFVSTLYE
ncbi:hypothetical protein ACFVS2_20220 [Brevibacillus sp. NPDC058079]|uniref:hypothetical protein n=1 Tax=Brevibacillus sp. NPDC058079 TaxID=3346330 RepID=UPI0036E38E0A